MKHWIPNAVTLTGALCALLSMIWAPERPYWACNALIAAALCDLVDGRIARLLDAQSPIGEQLDSLVDVIAFGVAPAWLLYSVSLHSIGAISSIPLGVLPMFAYVAATALRLALFNHRERDDNLFFGVPSPVAALLLVTAVMTWLEVRWSPFGEPWFLTSLALGAALLMVLPIPLPSYKRFRSRVGQVLYFGAMAGGLTMLFVGLPGGTVLFGFMALYVVRGLGTALLRR